MAVMEYDDILEHIGGMGRFQILLFNLLAVMAWEAAYNAFVVSFHAVRPEFICIQSLPEDIWNSSQPRKTVWSLALNYTKSVSNATVDQCKYSPSENTSQLLPCTRWIYDPTDWEQTMTTEWDLVCDRTQLEPLLFAAYAAGQAVGIVLGLLADKFGRCTVIRVCLVFEGLFTVLQAASMEFYVFILLRFTQGFFSCVFLLASVTITEFVGCSHRALVSNCFWLFWCIGYITLPGLAWLIRQWRILQVATAIPTAAYILVFLFLPESPRWLLANHRTADAIKVCEIIARVNGKKMPPIAADILNSQPVTRINPVGRIKDLFITKTMTKKSLALFLAWATISFTYYGISLDVTFVSTNIFVTVALAGFIEIPAYAAAYIVAQKIGRRWPLMAMYLILAGSLICINLVPKDSTGRTIVALIAKLMVTAAFSLLINYTAELYPTSIRNFGVFCCNAICRATTIFAPFVAMNDNVPRLASTIVFAVLSGVSGLVLLVLPETRNIPLPQTVNDADLLKQGQEIDYFAMVEKRKADLAVYFVTSTQTLTIFNTNTAASTSNGVTGTTPDDDHVAFSSSKKYLIDPYS